MPALATPQGYVEGRLAQHQEWYDHKATRMKAVHLRMRTVSVVGGALGPVLVNLDMSLAKATADDGDGPHPQVHGLHPGGLVVVPLLVLSEATATALSPVVVARVEKAIANENSATLDVMTLGGQVYADVQRNGGVPAPRPEGPQSEAPGPQAPRPETPQPQARGAR
jgi:hypothetical protein